MLNLILLLPSRWALGLAFTQVSLWPIARRLRIGTSPGNSIACRMRAAAGVKTTSTGTAGI